MMPTRASSSLLAGWAVLAFSTTFACSSDEPPVCDGEACAEPDAAAPDANQGSDRSDAAGASGPRCEGPGYTEVPELVAFEELEARVEDLAGNPLASLQAQACGLNICLNDQTGPDGTVLIQSESMLDKPAFKYGRGQRYAKFAYLLTDGPRHAIGTHRTVEFPDASEGAELEPGAEAASGPVTLSLSDDLDADHLDIDPFDFDTEELQRFRAAEVPIADVPPAVDPELELERVIALTPVGAEFCPAASVTVVNTLDWEPGTPVEFFLHGVEVEEIWAPYGGWALVSTGVVSDDGETITTTPGQGLPALSVVGIRRGPN